MQFTFDNGRTVEIVRVSPLTWRDFERGIAKPKPPMQTTELGEEPNYAHPDYLIGLAEYQEQLTERRTDALIMLGVDAEIDQDALTKFRGKALRVGMTVDEDDVLAYVKHICITTTDDITHLTNAILGASVPTEEKIGERADEFKSPVETQ